MEATPKTLAEKLEALKAEGLTFSDCVNAFGVDRDSDTHAKLAQEQYGSEGEVEIDSKVVVSYSEGTKGIEGAYVMAWVYVEVGVEEAA